MTPDTAPFTWQDTFKPILLTLLFGYLGAVIAPWLHLPVPALLGSGILVAVIAFSPLKLGMPVLMRNIGFTILGCSMGSSITPEMLALIGRWPLSLVILAVTVVAMMAVSTWVLARFFGHSRMTGLLASTPGALSMVLALSSSGHGNLRAVIVLQSLRLLVIMAVLPVIIGWSGMQGSSVAPNSTFDHLPWHSVPALLFTAFAIALMLDQVKLPAAYVLTGLLLSAGVHISGWMQGNLPVPLVNLGFVIIGCVIGVRFQGIKLPELKAFSLEAMLSVFLSTLVAALGAAVTAWGLDLPYGQVWIAYAPGGIEAMAALALALHYDPAYIAAHHLARIIGLTLIMPLVCRWVGKYSADSNRPE